MYYNLNMELRHVIKLCEHIAFFELQYKHLPYLVSSPQLIQEFITFNPENHKSLMTFRGIMNIYREQKGTFSYQNALMPPGLVVFKLNESIIPYRIYDSVDTPIKENEIHATTGKSIFTSIKFTDFE